MKYYFNIIWTVCVIILLLVSSNIIYDDLSYDLIMIYIWHLVNYNSVCVMCGMALIELMHCNKPDITVMFTYVLPNEQ